MLWLDLAISLFSIILDAGWVRQVATNALAKALTNTTGTRATLARACPTRLSSGNTPPGRSMDVSKDGVAEATSSRLFSTAPCRVSICLWGYHLEIRIHTLSFRVSENNHKRASCCCSAPFPLQKIKGNLRPANCGARFSARALAAASV